MIVLNDQQVGRRDGFIHGEVLADGITLHDLMRGARAIHGGLSMFRKIDARLIATGYPAKRCAGSRLRGGVIEHCGHWLATACPQALATDMTALIEDKGHS